MIIAIQRLLVLTMAMLLTQCTKPELTDFQNNWKRFSHYYIDQGRVIDTANDDISHSEGQGYGMLFAVKANDKKQFMQIWHWTKSTLLRSDNLFSWKYLPCESADRSCIIDANNATDGDILIAWSLLIAAEQWDNSKFAIQAKKILTSIEQKLIREQLGYKLILPGEFGFEQPGAIQVNLSYWVFPALDKFYQQTGNSLWADLIQSGEELLQKARFGRWQLPPDWVVIANDQFTFDGALSAEYGYNACRVPLYLGIAGKLDQKLAAPFLTFWQQSKIPATVNLINDSVSDYSYSAGMEAIAVATKLRFKGEAVSDLPEFSQETDYYSASLILLSQLLEL